MPLKRTQQAMRESRRKALEALRNWFFTGIVVGAPIGITIWLVWSFVSFVDNRIKPLIPEAWNPETYLKFALPGLGIVVAVVGIVAIGRADGQPDRQVDAGLRRAAADARAAGAVDLFGAEAGVRDICLERGVLVQGGGADRVSRARPVGDRLHHQPRAGRRDH